MSGFNGVQKTLTFAHFLQNTASSEKSAAGGCIEAPKKYGHQSRHLEEFINDLEACSYLKKLLEIWKACIKHYTSGSVGAFDFITVNLSETETVWGPYWLQILQAYLRHRKLSSSAVLRTDRRKGFKVLLKR
jgi:hypothetical protein